jgi:hypothetical protein
VLVGLRTRFRPGVLMLVILVCLFVDRCVEEADEVGYDKASNPVQVLPRKVPAISQPVLDVALSVRVVDIIMNSVDVQDYAMICLVDSFEVICFHHDVNFKIV